MTTKDTKKRKFLGEWGEWSEDRKRSYMMVILGISKEKNDDIEGNECCFDNCKRRIGRWGHNARPCVWGRCCAQCNYGLVVPERIRLKTS